MTQIITTTKLLVAMLALTLAGCTPPIQNEEQEPALNVDATILELDYQGGIASFNLTSNVAWTITTPAEWLSVIPTSGSGDTQVLCSYKANNTGRTRSNKIEVSAAQDGFICIKTISVLQKGNADEGGNNDENEDDDTPEGVIKATIGEFLDAEVSDSQWYRLTGTVEYIDNDTYGNFDLNDGTGKVFIYGLCASQVSKNDKSFSSLGIKEGDIVTLHTLRNEYNGQAQGGGNTNPAYYISHTEGSGNDDGGNDDGGNDDCGNDDGGNDDGGNDNLVTNGGTPHAGWAELPAEEDNNDYYYAYHMIPDKGNGKVRNFAVCYSEELGCPVWVASPMHSYYTQKNTSRSDAYAPDPEIPSDIQVHKRSGYTRGHLLGSADRLVSVGANKQAFYYSNIAPQLSSGFNTGGGVWNNLESFCDEQLCADTLYMVNGCHWEHYNKQSSGTVIPTHYYKVLLRTKKGNSGKWVINCSRDELKCVVFMVEHNSSQHKVQPHTGMMMSVKELEELTGHTFFPNVPNAPKDTYNPSDWGL